MSRLPRKFNVPDELANLYDFANSLDVRHFTHHGVQHPQSDELTEPRELGAWLAERGLLRPGVKVTREMLSAALQLRADIRAYLGCDPAERRKRERAAGLLDRVLEQFPLIVQAGRDGFTLRACRDDALAGLSAVVAELYNGSTNGTLARLKMCAAEECRRVFFDRSKPATRRWCMSTLCGNRMKTRAYRARQHAAD